MTSEIISQAQITAAKVESRRTVEPLVEAAAELKISDAASYQAADFLLKRVRIAKRAIEEKLNPIIEPIYQGLQSLYKLRKELTDPLEKADADIREGMSVWQMAESRRIAAEAAARREEEDRLRREAEEKQRKIDQAKSESARKLLAKQALVLESKADAVAAVPVEAPTQAVGSSVRKVWKWRVASMRKLIQAVADGRVPQEILAVDTTVIGKYFRDDPASLSHYPGIEVYEDIVIAGRKW
jgi:hypothetical protein